MCNYMKTLGLRREIISAHRHYTLMNLRKRLLLWAITLVFCVGLPFSARAEEHRDGNWWRDTAHMSKLAYMVGFFDGMELGHEFSYWHVKTEKGDVDMAAYNRSHDSYRGLNEEFFSNVTSGQLVDGLDHFYEDYRNRSILITDAAWIVVNTIAGKPAEMIEQLTQNFRAYRKERTAR